MKIEDLEDALERTGALDGPSRCGAPLHRTGNPCKNRPMPGGTRCKFHGGKQSGKAQELTTKHGLSSRYVKVAELPEILARVAELRTPAGKETALLTGAAITEARLGRVPDKVEFLDAFVAARKSIREDLKTSHELTDEKPTAPTTFVLNNFDPQQHAPFQSRTVDGPCQIRYLEGEPFMLEGKCWVPALKQVDEESSAEYYVRLIEG